MGKPYLLQQQLYVFPKSLTVLDLTWLPLAVTKQRQQPTEGGKRYGLNFKKLRETAGLSQPMVAKSLGHAANANISQLENGKLPVPSKKMVLRHAAALGCTPDDLMDGVTTPHAELTISGEIGDDSRRLRRTVTDTTQGNTGDRATGKQGAPAVQLGRLRVFDRLSAKERAALGETFLDLWIAVTDTRAAQAAQRLGRAAKHARAKDALARRRRA